MVLRSLIDRLDEALQKAGEGLRGLLNHLDEVLGGALGPQPVPVPVEVDRGKRRRPTAR
ncbi:MAG: hypothetical protein ACON5B_11420 [Myxococcota bacterium]